MNIMENKKKQRIIFENKKDKLQECYMIFYDEVWYKIKGN